MLSDVKKFIRNILLFGSVILLCFILVWIGITQLSTTYFRTSYWYVVNRKYEHMMNAQGPKIIIVGGSNCAFGIDEDLIEETTGMTVRNVGASAEFGVKNNTDIAIDGIREGDIVVLAHEYLLHRDLNWSSPESFITGADDNIVLYAHFDLQQMWDAIKYFPTYTFKKLGTYGEKERTGTYSISSFDKDGKMILDRPQCILPTDIPDRYGLVTDSHLQLSDKAVDYINKFTRIAEKRGAHVVLTFPPVLDERFVSSEEAINAYESSIDDQLLAVRISEMKDYVFPREYMFDTIYHCNNMGEEIRSRKLAGDILDYLEQIEA